MAASCRRRSSTDRSPGRSAGPAMGGPFASGDEVGILRMPVEIVDDETAAGDHLPAVATDQLQRTLDQFRSNAAAAQRARRLGVGDDYRGGRQAVIGEGELTADIELEAAPVLVVAYRCRHFDSFRS